MVDIKVSIIVPVYKTEPYLRQCLDSILVQTLKEIEVICVNDGSPDGSLGILREYEQRDPRIVVIDKKNEGVGIARNDGIKKAQGEYIGFMDSDDFYPNDTVLEHLYRSAKNNCVKAAYGYYQTYSREGKYKDRPNGSDGRAARLKGIIRYSDYQYDFGYWAGIYQKKMILDNNIFFPPYSRFQDPPFFVRAMIAADTCYALDEPTYCYRTGIDSDKFNIKKTLGELQGIQDNLQISKQYQLSRLHYITACRLLEDASYMAIQNLFDAKNKELFARLIQTTACVDTVWLKQEGFDLPEPFLPEPFTYTLELAKRYNNLRQSKAVRTLTWLPRKLIGKG